MHIAQGASGVLNFYLKNFHPLKMTQNDILCHFESFLGGENFWGGDDNSTSAPCTLIWNLTYWMKDFFVITEKADICTTKDKGQNGHRLKVRYDKLLHDIGQTQI